MMRFVVALLAVVSLITACTTDQPPAATASLPAEHSTKTSTGAVVSTAGPASTDVMQSAQCPMIVAQALTAVDAACQRTGRNQICYGNVQLSAEFKEGVGEIAFASPGDIADLSAIRTVNLSPLSANGGQWGLALMRVQANLPDTLPGQNVTFLLFGDVELENVTAETGIPSSFYFRTGIGDSACSEAPSSGILVQTPSGVSEVTLRMNGVDIALGSTAYLQAQPGSEMTVSVIEGKAALEARGERQIVTAGSRSNIPMSNDLRPSGAPSPAEPYDVTALQNLPVNNLERQISVESVLISSDFLSDAEGWTSIENGAPIEYRADEPSSDGAVCSTDRLFIAPQSWLADRSAAFGGSLGLVARQEGSAPSEIILEGGGLSLSYTLPDSFDEDWSAITVPLSDDAGWMNLSYGPAAAGELRTALATLTALHIRGLGGCIDYVQLTAPVPPMTPYRRTAAIVPTQVTTGGTQQTFDIAIGDEIAPDLSRPGIGEIDGVGDTDDYRFEGQSGQQVYFAARGEQGAIIWSLIAPDGTVLFDRWRLLQGNDPGSIVLPQTGTYTVRVTGKSNRIGTYRFSVSEVGEGDVIAITPDVRVFEDNPAPGAGRIENPGEQDVYTFTLDTPQDVYFAALDEESRIQWLLTGPDDQTIFGNQRLWEGNDPGAFTLAAGEYHITVTGDGDSTGAYAFSLSRIPPPQIFDLPLDTLVGDGVPQPGIGRIESPGAQDVYTLELTESAELRFAALGEGARILWTLAAPDGTLLFEDQRLWAGNHPGVFTLDPGAYTVTVRGDLGQTGAYSFSVTHPGTTNTADSGNDTLLIEDEGEIATAGQQFDYSFDASAGQTVFLDIRRSNLSTYWTLTDPEQAEIFSVLRGGVSALGPYILEHEGEYRLTVSGYAEETGSYSFALWDVPAPDVFDIPLTSVIGPEVGTGAGAIETPGVHDIYTFEASAGQSIFIEVPEADFTAYWVLADPDGTQVFGGFRTGSSNIGLLQLERSGTHTLTVSGYQAETGTFRARIWEVPASDPIQIDIGDTISVEMMETGAATIESPGVQDIYTFDALPGQSILIEVFEADFTAYWQLTDPDGEQIFGGFRSANSIIDVQALEIGGQYALTVSGYQAETGSYRAKLWDVPQPDAFEIEIGAAISEETGSGAGAIESPGVQDIYRFEATAGQSVLIEVIEASFTVYWQLLSPDGGQIFAGFRGVNSASGVQTLDHDGTYTLIVSGYRAEVGMYQAKLWAVPEPDHFELALGQPVSENTPAPGAGALETPGVQDVYTFDAAGGQSVLVEIAAADFTVYWMLEQQDGEQIFAGYRGTNSTIGPFTLERTGRYRLIVSGYDREAGRYSFTILEQ